MLYLSARFLKKLRHGIFSYFATCKITKEIITNHKITNVIKDGED